MLGLAQWGCIFAALEAGVGKSAAVTERTDGSSQTPAAKVFIHPRNIEYHLTDT